MPWWRRRPQASAAANLARSSNACHHVDGPPRQRIFYELYRDRAAFDAHEQSPHTRRFLADRQALLESTAVDFLSLADGKTPASLKATS